MRLADDADKGRRRKGGATQAPTGRNGLDVGGRADRKLMGDLVLATASYHTSTTFPRCLRNRERNGPTPTIPDLVRCWTPPLK